VDDGGRTPDREGHRVVAQVSAPSLRAAVERVRRRVDSTLQPLPDHEFVSGLAAMERAAAAEATPTPVSTTSTCWSSADQPPPADVRRDLPIARSGRL
jgi:hypothetical protein